MTTLRPPLSSAVRLTVPLTPLLFCSTSFAFTVVSAAALGGRHSRAEAAASISKLRNLTTRLIVPPESQNALGALAVYFVNLVFVGALPRTSSGRVRPRTAVKMRPGHA